MEEYLDYTKTIAYYVYQINRLGEDFSTMMVSQKCQYALRATFELARRQGEGPIRIADLASAQAIPGKFLELILCDLKQGQFVESRRGRRGGYLLARPAAELPV